MPEDPTAVLPQASPLPIAPGQIVAERYLVGEVRGGGGMGIVCAGTHVLLGTPVASKLIHSELKDDPEAVLRFVNEPRAAAALKGEHIARVFDAGQLASGEPYLLMEQLQGLSLDQYLVDRGSLPAREAIGIVLQVCEGQAEAHAAALVHRDIKPGNLFLARPPGRQFSLKIIDFGIAKQPVRSDSPALASPGKTTVLTASPAKPSEICGDIAPELDAIVLRCLEKEPSRRFSSAEDLAQALRPFVAQPNSAALKLDPASVPAHDPASEARRSPTYDSLTPLHSTNDVGPLSRARHPLALALVLVGFPSIAFGGYLQARDPTLVRRALSATRITLPTDPSLSAEPSVTPLQPSYAPLPFLQTLHAARAVSEPQRAEGTDASAPPSGEGPRPRND